MSKDVEYMCIVTCIICSVYIEYTCILQDEYIVRGPHYTQPHGLSHIILFGPVLSRSSYMDSLIMYNTSIKTKCEVYNEFIKVEVNKV
jgi:hypothetical protein